MKKITHILALLFIFLNQTYSQQEPLKIAGIAQGSTYHITYYDIQNRDFQPEVEKILADFDKSVSTYLPTSIISKINSNQKKVIVDAYFIACFNKAKEESKERKIIEQKKKEIKRIQER